MKKLVASCAGIICCLGLTGFLLGGQETYAQVAGGNASQTSAGSSAAKTNEQESTTKSELNVALRLEITLKVIYLIMRPLLAIAGAAMDNSLVYGKVFFLTNLLWKFWNIMRSFANFALGVLFMIAVIKPWFDGKSGPSEIFAALKKLVLGALLVNMSWMIMAALIDLSTVATVGIGGIPLVATAKDETLKKIRFLKPYGLANLDQSVNSLQTKAENVVFYSCVDDKSAQPFFLPCYVNGGMLVPETPVSDPNTRASYKQKFIKTREKTKVKQGTQEMQVIESTISNEYCVLENALVRYVPNTLLTREIRTSIREDGVKYMEKNGCMTLDTMLQGAKGMSGPLFSLYASIVNTSELALSTNHKGIADVTIEFLMRVIMSLMLSIPLLIFAIIMIVRVAWLWLIIAASPIIVLVVTGNLKIAKMEKLAKENDISDILSLIFLPVIGTFAISLAVVFLSLLQRADFYQDVQISELLGVETKQKGSDEYCYDLKITSLCINESQRRAGNNIGNTFSYLFINGFGIVLMRAVVFAALKAAKLTEGIVNTLEPIGRSLLGAIPIIPTGSGMMSASGAKSLLDHGVGTAQGALNAITNKQNKAVEDYLGGLGSTLSGSKAEVEKSLIESLKSDPTTAQNLVRSGINGNDKARGLSYSDLGNNGDVYFNALAHGAGLKSGHGISTMQQAVSNADVMKSYGFEGINDIYQKSNNKNNMSEYYNKIGPEIEAGYQAQTKLKGNFSLKNGNDTYYFIGDRYIKKEGTGYNANSFASKPVTYKSGQNITTKEYITSFNTLIKEVGGSDALLKAGGANAAEIFKPLTDELVKGITATGNKATVAGTAVEVEGSGTNITNVRFPS